MGRKPGVSAAQTREKLLASAAKVFADQGYTGARVSEIARDAGLTTGAIYAHYATKADLLCDAIRSLGGSPLVLLRSVGELEGSIVEAIRQTGRELELRSPEDGALAIEAATAARRDPEVAEALRDNVRQEQALLADLVRAAQAQGEVPESLPPDATARFAMALTLGSLVIRAMGLEPVDPDDWAGLIDRIIDAVIADGG